MRLSHQPLTVCSKLSYSAPSATASSVAAVATAPIAAASSIVVASATIADWEAFVGRAYHSRLVPRLSLHLPSALLLIPFWMLVQIRLSKKY